MARINVDDDFFSDHRFLDLVIELGDKYRAIGCMVAAWKLAQRFWIPDQNLIPAVDWEKAQFPGAIFTVGLAEQTVDGIYVKGVKERFAWYFIGLEQRREAGRKSAEKRREKFGSAIPIHAPNSPDIGRTARSGPVRAFSPKPPNGAEPSSSSSVSSSKTLKTKERENRAPGNGSSLKIVDPGNGISKNPTAAIIAAYCDAFKSRYGHRPVICGKTQGVAKRIAAVIPTDQALLLVQAYIQMNDRWFITKTHDFTTFAENLNRVSVALHKGDPNARVEKIDWGKVFRGKQ